jgi:electron transport complex protein RnfG
MAQPFDLKALKELLMPVLKLLAICAGVALALALVNLITDPIIAESNLREKNKVLAELAGGAVRSDAREAFPLEISKDAWKADLDDQNLSYTDRSVLKRSYTSTVEGAYRLKPGLSEAEAGALAVISSKTAINRKNRVQAWYVLTTGDTVTGYLLELTGSGYGGSIDIVASYEADGTVRGFRVLRAAESPAQSKQIRSPDYDRHFTGTRGAGVPVVKAMLSRESADAVSGASISFMAVAAAIKDGSLFVMARGGA